MQWLLPFFQVVANHSSTSRTFMLSGLGEQRIDQRADRIAVRLGLDLLPVDRVLRGCWRASPRLPPILCGIMPGQPLELWACPPNIKKGLPIHQQGTRPPFFSDDLRHHSGPGLRRHLGQRPFAVPTGPAQNTKRSFLAIFIFSIKFILPLR